MSGIGLGPQGLPLTMNLSKAGQKAFFSYQDHRRYLEMERRYVERMFHDFPGS
jgi:hypothetical protein